MANKYGPKIVTDGLILCLDAANPKSYSGSGSTWTDLSGNNNNFTINGSTFNSEGFFNFVDNNGDYIISSGDIIGGKNDLSFDMFVKFSSLGGTVPVISYATTAYSNSYLFAILSGGTTVSKWQNASSGTETVSSSIWNLSEWIHLSVVRNDDVLYLYINGVLLYTLTYFSGTYDTGGKVVFGQEQDSVGGGFSTDQDFAGNLAVFRIYNKQLTSDEILQNYNATKGRFGL